MGTEGWLWKNNWEQPEVSKPLDLVWQFLWGCKRQDQMRFAAASDSKGPHHCLCLWLQLVLPASCWHSNKSGHRWHSPSLASHWLPSLQSGDSQLNPKNTPGQRKIQTEVVTPEPTWRYAGAPRWSSRSWDKVRCPQLGSVRSDPGCPLPAAGFSIIQCGGKARRAS